MRLHQLLVIAQALRTAAYDNGVGQRCLTYGDASDPSVYGAAEVKSVADAMIEQGMDKLGYKYVNMDDCWSDTTRSATGELQPVSMRFPSGMKGLADYLHSKGLFLGVYTCVGTKTCKGDRPGSYGYFEQDAKTLAGWGVDFVKADYCHHQGDGKESYTNFSRALNATGRPMIFSLCQWGNDNVTSWGAKVGQMYRIQMDHIPFWSWPPRAAGVGLGQGTKEIIEFMAQLKPSTFQQEYGYGDPDFLETLFPITMPFIESRTEYSFWVRKMNDQMRSIIMNEEVIAIDQDTLTTGGERLVNDTTIGFQVWRRPLANGDKAVIFYNPNDSGSVNIAVTWSMLGWPPETSVRVRDLWNKKG